MSGTSDFEQNKYIDATLRGQTYTPLTNVYVALFKCTKGIRLNSTAYALNDTITVNTAAGVYQLYKCSVAGTSAAAQPGTYLGTSNESITDGTAAFIEQSSAIESNTSVNEVTGGSYARAVVACTLAAWSGTQAAGSTVASTGTLAQTSNNAVIAYAQATANWTTNPEIIWGVGLYDALSGGNLIRWMSMITPIAVLATNTVSFAANTITVRVDR